MKPAVYDTMSVDIDNNGNIFKANSSEIVFDGYKRVYEDEDKSETKDKILPKLEEGMILNLIEWKEQQHFTQPAPRYTEGSLVKKLEELGIGRPSTFAQTVTLIQKRNYIKKEKKALYPTEIGRLVNSILIDYFDSIISYGFTADMENKLDEIGDGNLNWVKVIKVLSANLKKCLKSCKQ